MTQHVELGHASTIHRAQGMTVEHAHVLVHPGMTRQALYVALTRGRTSNHAYIAVDGIDPSCPHPPETVIPTGRQVLERVLATDGAELSATQTLRKRQDAAASLATLVPIRSTLLAAAARDRWAPLLLPHCGLDAV